MTSSFYDVWGPLMHCNPNRSDAISVANGWIIETKKNPAIRRGFDIRMSSYFWTRPGSQIGTPRLA